MDKNTNAGIEARTHVRFRQDGEDVVLPIDEFEKRVARTHVVEEVEPELVIPGEGVIMDNNTEMEAVKRYSLLGQGVKSLTDAVLDGGMESCSILRDHNPDGSGYLVIRIKLGAR